MSVQVEDFLTASQEQAIIEAIRQAEMRTSGEIRVHLESQCQEPIKRAQELFHLLKMDNTKEENGILFYVSVDDKKFALIGDRGIHARVGDDFWSAVRDEVLSRFRESEFQNGLIAGIELVGEKLAAYFPWDTDNTNELSNEISVS
ncbi:TPM domain-containing protein [Nonlabens sp.]|uniref:TPM domain-containing protein n=1 Tax=Nonlabens sp. TaxID=1888209 RepID=UPI001BD0EF27|nr:TPM domain-containing protein [Nonlabens sp.]